MAMIQKIRDNSALTFIVVGGALLAFVLTDSLSSRGGSEVDNMVGSFEGEEILIDQFESERKLATLLNAGEANYSKYNDYQMGQLTDYTWQDLLEEKKVLSEAGALGLGISETEGEGMLTGRAPYGYFVKYLYGGERNWRQNFDKISEDLEDCASQGLLGIEFGNPQQGVSISRISAGQGEIIKNKGFKRRIRDKYTSLVTNCFFTTSSVAKDQYEMTQGKKDVEVAYVKFSSVNDSTVTPSEAEIKAAYEELKETFKKKETESRKVVYATIPLTPKPEDRQAVISEVAEIKKELMDTSFDVQLILDNARSDYPNYVSYYKKGEFPIKIWGIDTVAFQYKEGDAIGPFTNPTQSEYGVAKILGDKLMADSAKVSAILVSPQPWYDKIMAAGEGASQEDRAKFQKAYNEGVDSILDLVKSNAAALASIPKEYWVDTTALEKGGDLGWIQEKEVEYGKNFADSVFESNVGDVKKVWVPIGQGNGFYAVLKVNEFGDKVRKLKIGAVVKKVQPLDKTINAYQGQAHQIAFAITEGQGIEAFRDSFNYFIDSTVVSGSTFNLRGVKGAREIVHWAFNSELNIPEIFSKEDSWVVAMATEEISSEYQTLEEVRYLCEAHARKKKQKALVLENFPKIDATNFAQFPELVKVGNGVVTNTTDANLQNGHSSYASEGEVVGAVAGLGEGQVSEPIEGKEGIYVVKINKNKPAQVSEENTFELEKGQLKGVDQRTGYLLVRELVQDKSDVVDNRKIIQ